MNLLSFKKRATYIIHHILVVVLNGKFNQVDYREMVVDCEPLATPTQSKF